MSEAAILSAAGRGDLDTVREIAESHPHLVNAHDDTGRTPLYLATTNGHGAVASFLMEKGNARWIPIVSFGSASNKRRSATSSVRGVSNRVEQNKQIFKRALALPGRRVNTRAHAIAMRNKRLAENAASAREANAVMNGRNEKNDKNEGDAGFDDTPLPPAPVRPPRPSNWNIVRNAPKRDRGSPRLSIKSTAGLGAGKRSARRAQRERAPRSVAIDLKVGRGDDASGYAAAVDAISHSVLLAALDDGPGDMGSGDMGSPENGNENGNENVDDLSDGTEEEDEADAGVGQAAEALAGAIGDGDGNDEDWVDVPDRLDDPAGSPVVVSAGDWEMVQ